MKRVMLLMLALLMLCVPALAEEIVELPDAVVTYTPPEGFYLLTRESSASVFNRIGLRQRDLLPWMEQNDVYGILYDLETGSELLMYLYPAEDDPLEALTPEELETELRRAEGMTKVAAQIVQNAELAYKTMVHLTEYGSAQRSVQVPEMLEMKT